VRPAGQGTELREASQDVLGLRKPGGSRPVLSAYGQDLFQRSLSLGLGSANFFQVFHGEGIRIVRHQVAEPLHRFLPFGQGSLDSIEIDTIRHGNQAVGGSA
jgi:hypothetical protein